MSRRVVGPFNRVEGDLEVHLDIDGDRVRDARVVSPLYRGFEQMLHGKDPRDALVYTPRICGICSVSQSVAAALALADTQDLAMPPNGEAAVNLILANENVADHLTHFYLFFMPDFARQVYADEPWHPPVAARFRAVSGTAVREVLPARADFMHLMGLLAGKWPHTLSIQPGGTTRSVEVQERMRIRSWISTERVVPPGWIASVCGHFPASSPMRCMKSARAGRTSLAADPVTARKRAATGTCQGSDAYTVRAKSGMKNR